MTITDHQRHNTEVLTAETASSSVVIPQYSRARDRRGVGRGRGADGRALGRRGGKTWLIAAPLIVALMGEHRRTERAVRALHSGPAGTRALAPSG